MVNLDIRPKLPFRIKICGVTNVNDALFVEQAKADAIGFNFYPRSLRHVSIAAVQEMAGKLSPTISRVGVFVNQSPEQIRRTARECQLDFVQLHGDERPEIMDTLAELAVIRCLRPAAGAALDQVVETCASWIDAGVRGILIDAPPAKPVDVEESDDSQEIQYGGTGHVVDWQFARELRSRIRVPLIVAGGLNPENVATAIAEVQPDAVDVASGVESFPGKKDANRLTQFVRSSRQAFTT